MTALGERLRRGPALLLERRRSAIERAEGRLTALSLRATLGRGYAIVRSGDAVCAVPLVSPRHGRSTSSSPKAVRRPRGDVRE